MSSNQKYLTELCQQISFKYPSISCNYQVEFDRPVDTGKSLSEALIFASTNPKYDDRMFIELPVHYMKNSMLKPGENMLYTEIVSDIQNNFCSPHVLQKEELLTKIYLYRNRYGGSLFTRHLFQPSFWGV